MLAHTQGRSLRLQKFVDLVNTSKLTPVTKDAKDNWPYKPEEFYAESYWLWFNEPAFLKANDKPIFDFFDGKDYLKCPGSPGHAGLCGSAGRGQGAPDGVRARDG